MPAEAASVSLKLQMLSAWGAPIPAQCRLSPLLSKDSCLSGLPHPDQVPDPSLTAPAKPRQNSANSGELSQWGSWRWEGGLIMTHSVLSGCIPN